MRLAAVSLTVGKSWNRQANRVVGNDLSDECGVVCDDEVSVQIVRVRTFVTFGIEHRSPIISVTGDHSEYLYAGFSISHDWAA